MNINDWASISGCFDKLNKQLEMFDKLVNPTGPPPPAPRRYIRILVELEDFLYKTLANKEAKKKMSTTNAKALNAMRQRLKKHNVAYQDAMDAFRANPESSGEEESEDESSGVESDGELVGQLSPFLPCRPFRSPETFYVLGRQVEEISKADGESKREKKKDEILTMKPEDITYAMLRNKLQEINTSRGKKVIHSLSCWS